MKALVAASQCPHCGHLLDLRDSFGELLPLTHCPSCACDYPTRDGKCRWCGTTPQSRRVEMGTVWKGVGVLAFAGMALGVWATRDAAPDLGGPPSTPNDSVAQALVVPPVIADTAVVVATLPTDAPRDTPVVPAMPVAMESADAPAVPEPAVTETSPPTTTARMEPLVPAPVAVMPSPSRVATRAPARPRTVGWRNVVARNWVTVRAAPRHGARLLGSFGPDTRIQLGESRAGWVRIRIQGLSGWVHEARLSTRAVRSRTLARR